MSILDEPWHRAMVEQAMNRPLTRRELGEVTPPSALRRRRAFARPRQSWKSRFAEVMQMRRSPFRSVSQRAKSAWLGRRMPSARERASPKWKRNVRLGIEYRPWKLDGFWGWKQRDMR